MVTAEEGDGCVPVSRCRDPWDVQPVLAGRAAGGRVGPRCHRDREMGRCPRLPGEQETSVRVNAVVSAV